MVTGLKLKFKVGCFTKKTFSVIRHNTIFTVLQIMDCLCNRLFNFDDSLTRVFLTGGMRGSPLPPAKNSLTLPSNWKNYLPADSPPSTKFLFPPHLKSILRPIIFFSNYHFIIVFLLLSD